MNASIFFQSAIRDACTTSLSEFWVYIFSSFRTLGVFSWVACFLVVWITRDLFWLVFQAFVFGNMALQSLYVFLFAHSAYPEISYAPVIECGGKFAMPAIAVQQSLFIMLALTSTTIIYNKESLLMRSLFMWSTFVVIVIGEPMLGTASWIQVIVGAVAGCCWFMVFLMWNAACIRCGFYQWLNALLSKWGITSLETHILYDVIRRPASTQIIPT